MLPRKGDARANRDGHSARAAGFTLLELLAVMAVVMVIIGLAVVRFDDSGQRATRASAERLSIALESARDAAIYSGRPVAFSSDGAGYQFWRSDDMQHKWLALTDQSALLPRKLQSDVRLQQQFVNDKAQALGERLVFSADGVSEPFTLVLAGGQAHVKVISDVLGRISVEDAQDEAHGTE